MQWGVKGWFIFITQYNSRVVTERDQWNFSIMQLVFINLIGILKLVSCS